MKQLREAFGTFMKKIGLDQPRDTADTKAPPKVSQATRKSMPAESTEVIPPKIPPETPIEGKKKAVDAPTASQEFDDQSLVATLQDTAALDEPVKQSPMSSAEKPSTTRPKAYENLLNAMRGYLEQIEMLRDEAPDEKGYLQFSKMRSAIGGDILWNLEHESSEDRALLLQSAQKKFTALIQGNEIIRRPIATDKDEAEADTPHLYKQNEQIDSSIVLRAFTAALQEAGVGKPKKKAPQIFASTSKTGSVRAPSTSTTPQPVATKEVTQPVQPAITAKNDVTNAPAQPPQSAITIKSDAAKAPAQPLQSAITVKNEGTKAKKSLFRAKRTEKTEYDLALEAFRIPEIHRQQLLMSNFFENTIADMGPTIEQDVDYEVYLEPLLIVCSKFSAQLEEHKASLSTTPEKSLELLLVHIKESRIPKETFNPEKWQAVKDLIKATQTDWRANPDKIALVKKRTGMDNPEQLLQQLDEAFNRSAPLTRSAQPSAVTKGSLFKSAKKPLDGPFQKEKMTTVESTAEKFTAAAQDLPALLVNFKKGDHIKDLIRDHKLQDALTEITQHPGYKAMEEKVQNYCEKKKSLNFKEKRQEKPDKTTRAMVLYVSRMQRCLSEPPVSKLDKSQIKRCIKQMKKNESVMTKLNEFVQTKPGARESVSFT